MIANNLAYPCCCSSEDLSRMRKEQEANKENFGYYGKYAKCSKLTPEEAIQRIVNDEPYIIRFRSKGDYNNKIVIERLDLFNTTAEQGQVSFKKQIQLAQNNEFLNQNSLENNYLIPGQRRL